ncbi:unnamed protein product [Oppiella nova]|uniref:Peptidase M13 N-terminal domain-containing protein n=1 Tax=Oppiella nova TaxID=334625 RepID=A0A7R9M903_9ACAR|nr:unnamed protein product [Oppiella nova]CAG2173011.1 unnamed protein product [Oppiella nova]
MMILGRILATQMILMWSMAMTYIQDVKKAYYELIAGNDWLDEITKTKSLLKLDAMKEYVGYPDWVLNNDELDKYYHLKQTVSPMKSFEALLARLTRYSKRVSRSSIECNIPMAYRYGFQKPTSDLDMSLPMDLITKLNGENTLGENIADNGGLRESYRAFQTHVQTYGQPSRLPHVPQYTPQQLFFISYTSVHKM